MRIAIVVPTLNEANSIEASLLALQLLRTDGTQVIVADGGSADGTTALAHKLADRVIAAPQGRARQMNAGAAAAPDADVLLFLHADTRLPAGALQRIEQAIVDGASWGRFDVRLSGSATLLRVVEFMMNVRSRLTGIATGDQCIFVRRELFQRLDGYADIALMEDIEFSRRAKRVARPACLRTRAVTSSRRWERDGVLRTIVLMSRLRLAYFFGADPAALARRYANNR